MKKLVSILLVAVLLISACVLPVYAETKPDTNDYKYYEKAKEMNRGKDPYYYEEVYYHYANENSEEPEWSFVYCVSDYELYDMSFGVPVEDVFVFSYDLGIISETNYFVYVTALDEFLRVDYRDIDRILELCPDFVEALKEQKQCALRGDVNDDFSVDIIDVTYIQRLVAGYNDTVYPRIAVDYYPHRTKPVKDHYYLSFTYANGYAVSEEKHYVADYNYDNDVTILDATAIQMKLAKVEE